MVKCTWQDIEHRSYKNILRPIRAPKSVKAFDTETLWGRAYLLTDSDKNVYEIRDAFDMLDVLADNRNNRSINFFYNLDYDVRAFLSYLDRSHIEELYTVNETWIDDTYLFYIPRKFLKVREGKRGVDYFDLLQFCSCSLNDASKIYLNKQKIEIPNMQWNNIRWIVQNYPEIVRYCIRDSVLTKEIGDYIVNAFVKLKVDMNKPYSNASISAQYFERYMPTPKFFNHELQYYAFNSYRGGRFECLQRGTFKNVFKIDIRSAYPYALSLLPDITNGRWFKVEGKIPEKATLGFIRCDIKVFDDFISPLTIQTKTCIIYPKAVLSNYYLTLQEFNMLDKFDNMSVTLKDAWVFIPNTRTLPFADINELYILKEQYKKEESPLAESIKIILNSIYGKTLEIIPSWKKVTENITDSDTLSFTNRLRTAYRRVFVRGKLFNPVVASYITAYTRCQVLDEIIGHENDTIAVFTDAVISRAQSIPYGKNLGDWALEDKGDLTLLGSGVYQFADREDKGFKIRGFKIKGETSLRGYLKRYEDKNSIPLPQQYALGLGRYLLHTNFSDGYYLNEMMNFDKKLDINFDTKRFWNSEFALCGDVLKQVHLSRTLELPHV